MRLSELKYMSDTDKIKVAVAGGLLLIAFFLIYWFGIRSPSPALDTTLTPASEVNSPDGPRAPNRGMAPTQPK